MVDKAKILIVDDNASLCKTMEFVLNHKGHDVTTAKDGPEALNYVEKKSFEIIFMDIKMPIMNGVETYKRLKEIRPETIVIMMTAYAVEDLVQEAIQEGAYGVIYKPLDIDKIIELIERVRQDKKGTLILVVDSDPKTCLQLKHILTKKHFRVGIANTGEEAISMAKEQIYSIIFISLQLPTLIGLETYLTLKEINPEAVVIIMIAQNQKIEDLIPETSKSGAYMCITKPIQIDDMLNLIEEIGA